MSLASFARAVQPLSRATLGSLRSSSQVSVRSLATARMTALTAASPVSKGFSERKAPAMLPWMLALAGSLPFLVKAAETKEPASSIISQADKLYDSGKTEELHTLLEKYVAAAPGDGAARWRFARACHDLAQLKKDPELKKKLIYEAHEHAKVAIQLSPKDFAAHKWAGITLSAVGDFEGNKVKIANAFIIKEHFDMAISLNPKDPTSKHLLGLWCFTFADMPWYMAKIAAALFATPPTSTYEESLRLFMAAEELEPGFYLKNRVMIGKTLLKMKRTVEAKQWLEKAVSMKVNNPDDEEASQEASKLLKSL